MFDSKPKEECRYIQKVVEDRLSKHNNYNNVMIFLGASGFSIVIAIDVSKDITTYFLNDLKITLYFIIGFVLLLYTSLYFIHRREYYKRCSKIILDAEERLIILEP